MKKLMVLMLVIMFAVSVMPAFAADTVSSTGTAVQSAAAPVQSAAKAEKKCSSSAKGGFWQETYDAISCWSWGGNK